MSKISKKTTKNISKSTKKDVKKWRPKKRYLETSKVQKMLSILQIDWTIEEACAYAGIAKQTHYNWIEQKGIYLDEFWEEKNYAEEIENAQEYPGILAKKTLFSAITKRWDEKMALEWLKRRDGRYKDKQEWSWQFDFTGNIIIKTPDE